MAVFITAHRKAMGDEGGWANNPADKGGETYKGISRKNWNAWKGWSRIDRAKAEAGPQPAYGSSGYRLWVKLLDRKLAADSELQQLVLDFYAINFWAANMLGQVENQDVADWVYNHVVNAAARGVLWIQAAARTTPDGDIGPKTIAAINSMPAAELLGRAEDIAGAYRLDVAAKDPSQIQFLSSWLERDGQPLEIIALVKAAAKDGRLDAREVKELKQAMEATA